MNIYATRIKRKQIPENTIKYLGVNEFNGKSVTIISGGHLNHNGEFQIFAATQGRWLMSVIHIREIKEDLKTDYYYICD